MNRIRSTGAVRRINPSSSVGTLNQIEDQIAALQGDITQIVAEYNSEVYPVLNSLPQGGKDSRWRLPRELSSRVRGLDGTTIFVDTTSSQTTDGGRYWNSSSLRPRTIKETLASLATEISSLANSLRGEIRAIGDGVVPPSLLAQVASNTTLAQANQANILQLAQDIYDEDFFSLDGDGEPNLDVYSIRDMLHAVLSLHGGGWNSSVALSHSGIEMLGAYYGTFVGATNEETALTSEVVIGGIVFDPSAFGLTITDITIYFEGLVNYIALGAAGSGSLYLYDMGAPGVIGAGVLRSTLTRGYLDGNTMDRERRILTPVESPGTNIDEIHETARVYELRIKTSGLGDPTDIFRATWGGITVVPTTEGPPILID